MKLRNNQGFTLIEIAIVLTIVGLIIGGIWIAASTVFNNNKSQQLTKDAIQVIQNTKTLFAGQGASASTNGFNTVIIANNSGIFPSDMVAGTQAAPIIITPFSTDPTTTAFGIAAPTNTTLTYTFGGTALGAVPNGANGSPQGLPSSACTSLITTLGSANNIAKLGISALGGTAAVAMPAAGVSLTAAAASAVCAAAGNSNSVTVTFSAI